MRPRAVIIVAILTIVVGLFLGGVAGTVSGSNGADMVHECAIEPDEDFTDPEDGNETIGWFDGYWYNESLDLNLSDGLTPEELEQLSARTAARIEALRCLSFEELPEIEVIDRETFAEDQAARFDAWDDRSRQFDNKQFEMLLTIGSDVDSVEVREESQAATVGGYYDYVDEQIVIVSDDNASLTIDEPILAHELAHALQDQHFDIGQYNRSTKDQNNGKLGVIEGDVTRLEHKYRTNCEEEIWGEPCMEDAGPGGGGASPPNMAYYYMSFQPYSDGPAFIEYVYEEQGWEGVNELYEAMPRASLYTIEPTHYNDLTLEELEVPDRSSEAWERLSWEDGPDHNVIGQAGIASIFMGQSADAGPGDRIVSPLAFQNVNEDNEIDRFNPFNYQFDETDGWRGDRLYVYADDRDRTASVWKTSWSDTRELNMFLSTYVELIQYQGGEPVAGYEDTWTFGADSEFDKVVTLQADGDRLWIVAAPELEELEEVHGDLDISDTGGTDQTLVPGIPDWPPTSDGDTSGTEPSEDSWWGVTLVGFGVVIALLAILAVAGRHLWNRR